MIATQYSTASEATGCRHSIIARTLKTVVECRHPVASLAVLYRVSMKHSQRPQHSMSEPVSGSNRVKRAQDSTKVHQPSVPNLYSQGLVKTHR